MGKAVLEGHGDGQAGRTQNGKDGGSIDAQLSRDDEDQENIEGNIDKGMHESGQGHIRIGLPGGLVQGFHDGLDQIQAYDQYEQSDQKIDAPVFQGGPDLLKIVNGFGYLLFRGCFHLYLLQIQPQSFARTAAAGSFRVHVSIHQSADPAYQFTAISS